MDINASEQNIYEDKNKDATESPVGEINSGLTKIEENIKYLLDTVKTSAIESTLGEINSRLTKIGENLKYLTDTIKTSATESTLGEINSRLPKIEENLKYLIDTLKTSTSKQRNDNQLKPSTSKHHNDGKIKEFKPYWNSLQDEVIFNETLDRVNRCLEVAGKYGGRVFGGFVRNILIPKTFNQYIYGYKDVDIWFQTNDAAEAFVVEMGVKLIKLDENPNHKSDISYPFTRQQYILKGTRDFICMDDNVVDGIIIDVIVSENLPVNDFNVNQLTYSPVEGYKSFGKETTEKLMSAIIHKVADMLPTYDIGDKKSQQFQYQRKRIERMMSCGWMITHKDGRYEFN